MIFVVVFFIQICDKMSQDNLEVITIRPEEYATFLASRIEEIANEAIASRGVFFLGVSGRQ